MTKDQAQSSIKSLAHELSNLTPSALIALFEIDLSNLLDSKSIPTLAADAKKIGLPVTVERILRFHNNIKVFNSKIAWNGKEYYPVPIQATGFEASSKGTLPTPILSISSQSEEGVSLLSLLKHQILKHGDIIGCKVTRRRTFAKYLDWTNFEFHTGGNTNPISPRAQELPDGYEPDPNAELPKDVYFIERKTGENKNTIQYQLSSILDLEGVKIPHRTIVADKCNWQYRGPGCWYQESYQYETQDENGNPIQQVPILQKAELTTREFTLPQDAPPVATDKNELIKSITGLDGTHFVSDQKEWRNNTAYKKDQFVYFLKNKIKYYYVAKKAVPPDTPPPNVSYWVADECSKTLGGCRLRWGPDGPSATPGNCPIGGKLRGDDETEGGLPFGGFPAANKVGGRR